MEDKQKRGIPLVVLILIVIVLVVGIGLLAVSINRKVRRKNYFYCAEFAQYIIKESDINVELPYIIKPQDFQQIEGIKEIYKGLLRNYNFKV